MFAWHHSHSNQARLTLAFHQHQRQHDHRKGTAKNLRQAFHHASKLVHWLETHILKKACDQGYCQDLISSKKAWGRVYSGLTAKRQSSAVYFHSPSMHPWALGGRRAPIVCFLLSPWEVLNNRLESWIQTHHHAAVIARACLPLSHSPGRSCIFQKHSCCLLSSTWILCKSFFGLQRLWIFKTLASSELWTAPHQRDFHNETHQSAAKHPWYQVQPPHDMTCNHFSSLKKYMPALKVMVDSAHHPRSCTYHANLASYGGTWLPW